MLELAGTEFWKDATPIDKVFPVAALLLVAYEHDEHDENCGLGANYVKTLFR